MKTRYMKALRCENPATIPHQIWLLHPDFIRDSTGVDPSEKPMTASINFHKRFDVDNGGPVFTEDKPIQSIKGNKNKDGGVTTGEAFNTVWHNNSPFSDPEELWDFDPDPWGKDADKSNDPKFAMKNFRWCFQTETWDLKRSHEDEQWKKIEHIFPGKFTEGRGFYCTCFMWGICVFGWDVFLMALGLDPDKTGETLQRISEITVKIYEYYSTCQGCFFVNPHDDLCTTKGSVVSPEWYKKYIYPQYEKIFAPFRSMGKPVILTSDGNIEKLAPDLISFVDGFIFESSTNPDFMFKNFGKDRCLIGGIDGKVLAFGSENDIEIEVKNKLDKGRNCPGYVIACSDTIPSNVPIKNVYKYFECIEKYRYR